MSTGQDERIANIFCGIILFCMLVAVIVLGCYGKIY